MMANNTLKTGLSITGIPAFSDNYIWLAANGHRALVVDPGDADVVLNTIRERGLDLETVLITHHHPDHTGGLSKLLDELPDLRIIGPKNPKITQINERVSEGDRIVVLDSLDLQVIEVPGHTLDHIAFFASAENQNSQDNAIEQSLLFCGDTLFAGGCGRLFEGSPSQMHGSLSKLAALDDSTLIYCAHEYTESNLRFAVAVEPNNENLQKRLEDVIKKRADSIPTVPSNLRIELDTNPFLRTNQPELWLTLKRQGHAVNDEVAAFGLVRRWKDNF